jgi:hypothetical protein
MVNIYSMTWIYIIFRLFPIIVCPSYINTVPKHLTWKWQLLHNSVPVPNGRFVQNDKGSVIPPLCKYSMCCYALLCATMCYYGYVQACEVMFHYVWLTLTMREYVRPSITMCETVSMCYYTLLCATMCYYRHVQACVDMFYYLLVSVVVCNWMWVCVTMHCCTWLCDNE